MSLPTFRVCASVSVYGGVADDYDDDEDPSVFLEEHLYEALQASQVSAAAEQAGRAAAAAAGAGAGAAAGAGACVNGAAAAAGAGAGAAAAACAGAGAAHRSDRLQAAAKRSRLFL